MCLLLCGDVSPRRGRGCVDALEGGEWVVVTDRDEDDQGLTPAEREAHRWVRRLTSGEATEADAAALRRWCAQSAAHRSAFADARLFWATLEPAGSALRDDEARDDARRRTRQILSRRAMLGGALAASVAAAAVIRPPLDLWPSIFELEADYRTGTGEQRQVAIADVASVEMNTRTSLSVGGHSDGRTVALLAGEASFHVTAARATSDAQPFSVVAAGGTTSATDARFDIRVDGASVRVTCLADRVDVTHATRTVTLAPREQVRYDRTALGDIVTVDPAVASAWRQGLIICNNTPLTEVVAELNRYRSGRIVVLRSEIGRLPVSGRFRIAEPDQALLQLEHAFGIRVRSLPGGLALLS